MAKKKDERTIRSSAAEYLTYLLLAAAIAFSLTGCRKKGN